MRNKQIAKLFFCLLLSNLSLSFAVANNLASIKAGGTLSTLGRGNSLGLSYERIPESGFGFVSEVNYGKSKANEYEREFTLMSAGVDLPLSSYLSIISSLAFKIIKSQLENSYVNVSAETQSFGVSNGLSSRWTFSKNFYFAVDWLTVFTPLSTKVQSYQVSEKLRISGNEQRRIARSFYRTEVNGHGTLLSPRIGYSF